MILVPLLAGAGRTRNGDWQYHLWLIPDANAPLLRIPVP